MTEDQRRMRAAVEAIENQKKRIRELEKELEDAVMYFKELKHCANTNNQHAIINEALRLLGGE